MAAAPIMPHAREEKPTPFEAAAAEAIPDDELDCLACGACCRQASDGRILVPAEDLVRWRRLGRSDILDRLVEGHFSELAFASTPDGACVHLGTTESPNACSIYAERGTTCRDFDKGSWQCREFRRDAGLEPPTGTALARLAQRSPR